MPEDEDRKDPPPPSLSPPPKPPPVDVAGTPPPAPANEGGSVEVTKVPQDSEEDEENLEAGSIAPLNSRLLAGLIDGFVASGLYWLATMILPGALEKVGWLVFAGYWIVRDSLPFMKGQSVGKMAMKLKVEKADGGDIVKDWESALIRNAALLIPIFGLVEAIILISRDSKPEKGLRLGDEWAKTKVVTAPTEDSGGESDS
ncbi:RDD domain-containing protein [Haloferula helveola]|uniref:RDD domain-containing protein n=1 Tax=Haloferula helveola TaxID=490095 RepID=A0ABN6H9D0_9BACT|nr:RDD domain-containing protein [Haloferula helveola]